MANAVQREGVMMALAAVVLVFAAMSGGLRSWAINVSVPVQHEHAGWHSRHGEPIHSTQRRAARPWTRSASSLSADR